MILDMAKQRPVIQRNLTVVKIQKNQENKNVSLVLIELGLNSVVKPNGTQIMLWEVVVCGDRMIFSLIFTDCWIFTPSNCTEYLPCRH